MDETDERAGKGEKLGRRNIPYPEEDEQPVRESKWHPVTITKVANGFILQAGCELFVAKTWAAASTGLADYWEDPDGAEKRNTTLTPPRPPKNGPIRQVQL